MSDDLLTEATDALYAGRPDAFTSRRDELAKEAKAAGDHAAAKAIAALRKPTAAAAVVNRLVHHAPDSVDRLVELADRLRRAHRDPDAATLRELTGERRALVREVTDAAFAHAGRDTPPTGLRDEVSGTFDAAVADPDIASRLGRLPRPESFSGFGVLAGPDLTLVAGDGRPSAKTTRSTAKQRPSKKTSAATSRRGPTGRLTREAEKARTALTAAEAELASRTASEQAAQDQVANVTARLREIRHELDDAELDLERTRTATRKAKSARREARSALDRAERRLRAD